MRRLGVEALEERCVLAADFAADQLLVQFQSNIAANAQAEVLALVSGKIQEHVQTALMRAAGNNGFDVLQLAPGSDVLAAAARLKNNPWITFAEPNWKFTTQSTSNDPYYSSGSLWGMYGDASSPTNQYGSQAAEAWAKGAIGSASVYVGIVDEGIDYSHPDLAANVWTNPYDAVDGIDNDGNGYIDDVHGWDFVHGDNSIFDAADGDDHGTHVAGTIGGVGGNGVGVSGVAWNVGMISTKFLGPTGGYTSDAVKALDYLTDLKSRHNMNIVASNNSWGGGGASQALADAIARSAKADILFIAAAGNGGSDGVGDNNDTTANYPSNYNTNSAAGYDSVIAVAAINSSGALASFSNYGAATVDLGAPGVSILSTLPGGGYGYYSGTSMATPHVTGAVALYAASHPGASALAIKNAVLSAATSTATTSLSGKTLTGGRLNAGDFGDVLPGLAISDASIVEGNSGAASLAFTVSLSAVSAQTVTVNYATANGTATSGSDYAAGSGTLTFAPGVLSQTILVSVLGDTTAESNETFAVNLSGAVNAAVLDGQGLGTIVNDDVTLPKVSINSVTTKEGGSGFTNMIFTLSLSAASKQSISVSYATVDGTAVAGSDYVAQSGTVTFAAGATKATITIKVYGDAIAETNETFYVRLSAPTNAVLGTGTGTGTIQNDDRSKGGALIAGANTISTDLLLAAYGEYFTTSAPTNDAGKTAKVK